MYAHVYVCMHMLAYWLYCNFADCTYIIVVNLFMCIYVYMSVCMHMYVYLCMNMGMVYNNKIMKNVCV
jgi:hypothetical protein